MFRLRSGKGKTTGEQAGTLVPPTAGAARRLVLVVGGPGGGGTFALPASGTVTIGRAEDCLVSLDDPLVSRRHAALHLGGELAVEDLESANGTYVGARRIEPGRVVPVDPQTVIGVGSATLVLRQSDLPPLAPERLLLPAELASELQARADAGEAFALIRIQTERRLGFDWIAAIIDRALARDERIVGVGADRLCVVAKAASAAAAEKLLSSCLDALGAWGVRASGAARFFAGADDAAVDEARAFAIGETAVALPRGPVIFRDPAMESVRALVDRVAPAPMNVLILGETGVGKDVVASLLHERSNRRAAPFVPVNCAALAPSLLESELFGHEKGAFTGAVAAKVGLLESAQGGTVFLDEIGEMAMAVQAKLLRAIETREITRVGGVRMRPIDVRFVAATNRDLVDAVKRGEFRQDLLFRLDGISIVVPPLRDRPADIQALAEHFLTRASAQFGRPALSLSPEAVEALRAHRWPGNVRELRNTIERAAVLAEGAVLSPADLRLAPAGAAMATEPRVPAPVLGTAEERERKAIIDALDQCAGNQSRAAELLGMPRRTFVRKVARYGLPRPRGAAARDEDASDT